MARLLAIDYGAKRTGIAVTDDLQIIASALITLTTTELLPFLKKYCSDENVETIIIGLPRRMNNELSQSEPLIKSFIEELTTELPHIPIVRYDERFTSKLAIQTLIDSGVRKKKRQNKELLDQISATIILQSYMDSR